MECRGIDSSSDRKAPDHVSLESLRSGRAIDLDAKEGGFISRAIEAGQRDVVELLARRLPVQRGLKRELPLLCRWIRLAIRFRQREIFQDLLERHADVVRNGAAVNYPLLFASMVYWDDEEPEEDLLAIVLEWFKGLDIPLARLWSSKRFNIGGKRHPLYLAFQQRRFDLADVFLALGASLQDRPSGHRSVLQIIYEELDRTDMWRLIERALAMRSTEVISMDDVVGILLNWNHRRVTMSPQDVEVDMYHADYPDLVGWTKSKGRFGRLLRWQSPFDFPNTTLWAHIAKAGKVRKPQLRSEQARNQNLVLHAALQSNWAAARCLLDMGFHPNGTGSYGYSTTHHVYQLPLAPLDVAEWTSCVPDKSCTEAGLQLKRNNRAIARLLKERGASHSGAYTLANLAATPFLTTWEYLAAEFSDTTHHNGRIGLLFSMAGFLVGLVSLWLLWYLAGLVSTFTDLGEVLYFLFWCLAVPNVVLICWAVFWLPLQVLVRGHRKRAYAKLVHGGNLRAFWVSAIGRENAVCRFLVRLISGWSERGDGVDREVDGLFDGHFEREMLKEYESIAGTTTRVCMRSPSEDKKGVCSPLDVASSQKLESSADETIELSVQGRIFKFALGSPESQGHEHGGSTRRKVRFENQGSDSEGETTSLLVLQRQTTDGHRCESPPKPALRLVTTWPSHGGYGTRGQDVGVSDMAGLNALVPRQASDGDEPVEETPAWNGQELQRRMFLMNARR